MKVRIKVQPTGYVSLDGGPLNAWPKVGSVVELPDVIADDLIANGHAEKARLAKAETAEKVETRPAPVDEEQRPARRPTPATAAKKGTSDGA